jgi:hypothetical protein
MVYQQHKQQQQSDGCPDINPCTKFWNDLIIQLQQWWQAHDHLILLINANENTITSPLNAALTDPGLQMQEGVQALHPDLPVTPTFLWGTWSGWHPIDAAYLMPDLPLEAGSWILAKCSPGDHWSCILEIWWKSFVGKDLFKIAWPEAWRQRTSVYHSTKTYERLLLDQITRHKIIPKLHSIYKEQIGPLLPVQQQQMETIDRVKSAAMVHAESKCSKFCMGEVDFLVNLNMIRGWKFCW